MEEEQMSRRRFAVRLGRMKKEEASTLTKACYLGQVEAVNDALVRGFSRVGMLMGFGLLLFWLLRSVGEGGGGGSCWDILNDYIWC